MSDRPQGIYLFTEKTIYRMCWCLDTGTCCWNCQYIMKCGVTFGELANVNQLWKIVEIIVSCEKVLYDHCLAVMSIKD